MPVPLAYINRWELALFQTFFPRMHIIIIIYFSSISPLYVVLYIKSLLPCLPFTGCWRCGCQSLSYCSFLINTSVLIIVLMKTRFQHCSKFSCNFLCSTWIASGLSWFYDVKRIKLHLPLGVTGSALHFSKCNSRIYQGGSQKQRYAVNFIKICTVNFSFGFFSIIIWLISVVKLILHLSKITSCFRKREILHKHFLWGKKKKFLE